MSPDDHSSNGSVPPEPSAASEPTPLSPENDVPSFESFEYYPDERTHRAMFDAEEVAPSAAVVGAVATVAGEDPLDVAPLHSVIDPDALDALLTPGPRAEGDVRAKFSFVGYDVTLSSYGSVVVRPSQADES